jgi:hypothetical protein
MFDLTPAQCRDEAGPDWLDLRTRSPRLVAAAGDQVPPGALEHRIFMMRELVDRHGRY